MNKVKRFREIADTISELYEKKNSDYGDSFGETWTKLGKVSALTRMSDKLNRLISLMTNKTQQVKDESINDTLMDLAAYSIMTAIELEFESNKNNEELLHNEREYRGFEIRNNCNNICHQYTVVDEYNEPNLLITRKEYGLWEAYMFAGYRCIGYGKTEGEAINNLIDQQHKWEKRANDCRERRKIENG